LATTDIEKLLVQLSADIKGYEREMRKAVGVTNAQARAIENRIRHMSGTLDAISRRAATSVVGSLAGISAALSVREVAQYADAWTTAKNSLAVANVVGERQVSVLEDIFDSAQRNAAPIVALSGLYGKASQANDNLNATQERLLEFTDGVATALRVEGKAAEQASGALTQLGQLLGQTRVQAEEFNSVNEGARPILIAVANGLDEAGGSVSKLKQLVNEEKVSGKQFFDAFLRGLPTIRAMAANSTQTIEQGLTKVDNAFTKYIGSTDESLAASQRLVVGLNALADNFEGTADIVLQLAAVIAGALVGRSIAGMIAKLGLGVAALGRFSIALRAATTMAGLSTAFGGLSAAAGPVGLVIGGVVVTSLALFASASKEASAGARVYAEALAEVEAAAANVAPAVDAAAGAIDQKFQNELKASIEDSIAAINEARQAAVDLFTQIIDNAPARLITPEQLASLGSLRDGLENGEVSAKEAEQALYALANSKPDFQSLADQLSPLLQELHKAIATFDVLQGKMSKLAGGNVAAGYQQYGRSRTVSDEMVRVGQDFAKEAQRRAGLSKDQLSLENEIAKVRADADKAGALISDKQVEAIASANIAADARRGKEGKSSGGGKKTAGDRFAEDLQQVRDRTTALIAEREALSLTFEEQQRRAVSLDLEQEALRELREEARRKGVTDLDSIKLSEGHRARIDEVSAAYARQAEALRRATEMQDLQRDVLKGAMGDFRAALEDGKITSEEWTDIVLNGLDKIIDKVENDLIDAILQANGALSSGGNGGGGGGILGFLGNLFGGGGGGTNFAALGATGKYLFDSGGYTGAGGKRQPAGVVHKGEYVFDQDAVRAAGGPAALEAMRRGLKGFANGGYVGAMPALPSLPKASGGMNITVDASSSIVAPNADKEGLARLERIVMEERRQLPARVVAAVRDATFRGRL